MGVMVPGCESCPLNNSRKVLSSIPDSPKLLVVGQSPGRKEQSVGKPFVGKSGQLIRSVIGNFLDTDSEVAYINAMRCRPVDASGRDRQPLSSELKCCKKYFLSDLHRVYEKHNIKITFIFGAVAKKQLQHQKLINPYYFEHPASVLRKGRDSTERFKRQIHAVLTSIFSSKDLFNKFQLLVNPSEEEFQRFTSGHDVFAVDTETNSLNIFGSDFRMHVVTVSSPDAVAFIDIHGNDIPKYLAMFLLNASIKKVFANVLFDVVAFEKLGFQVNNYEDIFPLAFMLDNTYHNYDLKSLVFRNFPHYAGYERSVDRSSIMQSERNSLIRYACYDAILTLMLYNKFIEELKQSDMEHIYNKITVPLLPVLVNITMNGIKVDIALLREYKSKLSIALLELKRYLLKVAGINNINSAPQVRKWLYEDKKVKVRVTTEKGLPSTNKRVIKLLARQIPDVMVLYEARRISHLFSYFFSSLEEHMQGDGFIHPIFKHYGVQTFRLACKSPNIQGIPRSETGLPVLDKFPLRRLFISRSPDYYIAELDYSQQEVRIIACLSQDQNMLRAYQQGKDIHRFVASIIFSKSEEEISKFERQIAKGCVFGAIFGASARELALDSDISEQEASKYLNTFFLRFPSIKRYIDYYNNYSVRRRLSKTVLGRKRRFLKQEKNLDVGREGANFTIQSLGADFTFLSLIKFHKYLKEEGLLDKCYIINVVHDSIMIDVHKDYLVQCVLKLREIMTSIPAKLGFPIEFKVDYKIGRRWSESVKELEQLIEQGGAV